MTDPLLERLRAQSWPEPAWNEHPEPAAGQVWRLLWDTHALLAMVTGAGGRRHVPVAVADSAATGDHKTVVFDRTATASGAPLAVWTDLIADLPLCVFDICVDTVPADRLQPPDDPTWPAITDPTDDRAAIRADLADRLDFLRGIEWVPAVDAGPTTSLGDLARERGLAPSRIAEVLNIMPGQARALLDGVGAVDDAQASALAGLFDVEPAELISTPSIPDGLASSIDNPIFKTPVRTRATMRFGGDERAARISLATDILATAARTEGRGEPDWETLISDVLRT